MRTSATGNRGFTLVELLVVLAIIGLASGVVVMTMPDPRGDIVVDAERFAARAKAAQDAAVLDARPMALWVTGSGYGFERRERAGWRPLADRPFEERPWSKGARALVGEAGRARIIFDVTGVAEPLELTLLRDDARVRVSIGGDGAINVER